EPRAHIPVTHLAYTPAPSGSTCGQAASLLQIRCYAYTPDARRLPPTEDHMVHSRASWRTTVMATLTAFATVLGVRVTSAQHATATPSKHVVVIFQYNVSFDHYFGTYPHAANPPGEPVFQARPGTPGVNGLTDGLLAHNPNVAN